MGADYSKYYPNITRLPDDVCGVYIVSGRIYTIGVPNEIENELLNCFNTFYNKEGVIREYSPTLKKLKTGKYILTKGSGEKQSCKGKQLFCKYLEIFCRHGWSMINSPTLSFEHSLSVWYFVKVINPFMVHTGNIDSAFCAIGLSSYDKLQLISFPEHLINGLVNCCKREWDPKTEDTRKVEELDDVYSVSLTSCPWSCHGESSLRARSLVLAIIRYMSRFDWRLVNSTAMKIDASDTMYFRKYGSIQQDSFGTGNGSESLPPGEIQDVYFMLALMSTNYLSVIGADEKLLQFIADSCVRHEPKGIKPKEIKNNFPSIIFISDLWNRRNEKETKTRRFMTLLFQDMASIGWMPAESIDCSRRMRDLSSIAFVRIPPTRMMYFCMAPKKYNGLLLINATDEVLNLAFGAFKQFYAVKPEETHMKEYGCGISLEFHGCPYTGTSLSGTLLYLQALAAVISALKSQGWFLVTSADTSNETKTRKNGDNTETIKWSIYALYFAKVLL